MIIGEWIYSTKAWTVTAFDRNGEIIERHECIKSYVDMISDGRKIYERLSLNHSTIKLLNNKFLIREPNGKYEILDVSNNTVLIANILQRDN
jgi:hypothetical protein